MPIITSDHIESILSADQWNPHAVLGMHPVTHEGKKGLVVRAFLTGVESCEVVDAYTDERWPLGRIAPEGLYEGFLADRTETFRYRLRVVYASGEIRQFYDPYSFLPTLSEDDLYLFNEGSDHYVHRKMGGHLRDHGEVPGASFAVWAPSAKRVSVVGDFNQWDGRRHAMRALGSSGVWEIFIPGLEEGAHYKFEIKTQANEITLKTDPYATFYESPPHNASILKRVDTYEWGDQEWMEARPRTEWKDAPLSIYEVHLGSWKRRMEDGNRPLSYREMARELTQYVLEMGYTHVEFLPLAEHPFTGSWGYQVTGYFAPSHRYGQPADFQYLVDTLHQNGIGVLIDWVPAHFPTDAFALGRFDGSALYEHADPREGFHHDWGTYIPNFGRHEVRCFFIASALAWMERFHIDGLRVDAVASMLYRDYSRKEGEWVPNQFGGRENLEAITFLQQTNDLVHHYYPGALMIAEESTSFPRLTRPTAEGGLGFDLKWNMGWMHDSLQYFAKDPIYRKHHHHNLTFGMIYQYSEVFTQVYSHDEVVHGKGSLLQKMAAGSIADKARMLRGLLALMWAWPGKKTLFMGCDIAQSAEWSYDGQVQWHLLDYLDHLGTQRLVRDLNKLYTGTSLFAYGDAHHDGFEWVSMHDADSSAIAFLRKDPEFKEVYLVVGHYLPHHRHGYTVGVPLKGYWREVFNSDAAEYGGCGEGNMGGVASDDLPYNEHAQSLKLTLPGNSTLVFKYEG
ncbi:MAG: 1,4-alpha-glucan branching protein GlgB [Verrucomicrobiota bacterium]